VRLRVLSRKGARGGPVGPEAPRRTLLARRGRKCPRMTMRDERIDNNSEDVLATSTPGLPSAPLPLSEGSAPRPPTARSVWIRDAPFLQLAAYYLLLLTLVAALMYFFPSTRRAFLSPVALPAVAGDAGEIRELLQGGTPTGGGADARMVRMALDR